MARLCFSHWCHGVKVHFRVVSHYNHLFWMFFQFVKPPVLSQHLPSSSLCCRNVTCVLLCQPILGNLKNKTLQAIRQGHDNLATHSPVWERHGWSGRGLCVLCVCVCVCGKIEPRYTHRHTHHLSTPLLLTGVITHSPGQSQSWTAMQKMELPLHHSAARSTLGPITYPANLVSQHLAG